MKFILCIAVSIFLHGLWWISPASVEPQWSAGVSAHEVSKVTTPLVLSFSSPTPVTASKAVSQPVSSQFKGVTHVLKKSQDSKAEIKPETAAVPQVQEKPVKTTAPEEIQVANKTEQIEPVKPVAAPMDAPKKTTQQLATAQRPSEISNNDNTPVRLSKLPLFKAPRPTLSYPLRAKRRGLEGVSIFEIELNQEGRITNLTLIKSSGYQSLDTAARQNVEQWQFHPVIHNGSAVKALFTVPIKFSLS